MSERETMQEIMDKEKAEAIATLNRANRALGRIFNLEEEGEKLCANCQKWAVYDCPDCQELEDDDE
jgi:hypothetical protein